MNVKLSRLNRIHKKDGNGIAIVPIDLAKEESGEDENNIFRYGW